MCAELAILSHHQKAGREAGVRHKYDKELFTHTPGGDLPSIVVAESENLQSKFVVQKVLELREQGVPLNTIAVLFRSG
ncbi:MAG TPA: hypothetical protein VL126_07445, partial [Bacteroidota bacterium]|nr:hypothetical protein [Bacteroidota bacterium]